MLLQRAVIYSGVLRMSTHAPYTCVGMYHTYEEMVGKMMRIRKESVQKECRRLCIYQTLFGRGRPNQATGNADRRSFAGSAVHSTLAGLSSNFSSSLFFFSEY